MSSLDSSSARRPWVPAVLAGTLALLSVAEVESSAIRLREVSEEWGLAFRHRHGGSGQRYIVETMGNGLVVFDFDGDGDPDVLWIDGAPVPDYQGEPPRTRLLRNDNGMFVDVSVGSGIQPKSYPQGGSAGDVDGDGDLDLYLTALGPNELWRNQGDGTFEDVTAAAGVGDTEYGASSAFADPDRDGDLDLYVSNYVAFTFDTHRPCITQGLEVYCHPGQYGGAPDMYYRNRGDGSFEDATAEAGLRTAENRAGLGVAFGDLDNDGWVDLYVANDAEANHLFRNRGDGTFEEIALLAGTAYGSQGSPEAGMGVDLGDVDGDGLIDIMVTNFELETNALYRNLGEGLFVDGRFALNVAESSLIKLAFGVSFADLDHDTDLDLAIANGHIMDNANEIHENSHYAQRNQILANDGRGRFDEKQDVGMEAVRVSRGLVTGDLDGDGDLDLLISNNDDLAEVYENLDGSQQGHWLQLDSSSGSRNSFGIGARLEARVGDRLLVREIRTASSYMSQSSLPVHFGLGTASAVDVLEIRWPSGHRQRFEGLVSDQRIRLYE